MIPYRGMDEIQCWHVARHRRQSSSQPAEFISELIFFSLSGFRFANSYLNATYLVYAPDFLWYFFLFSKLGLTQVSTYFQVHVRHCCIMI